MIDPITVATAASIIGVGVKDIFKAIASYWKSKGEQLEEERNAAYIRAEQIITQKGLSTKLLVDYYRERTCDCGYLYSFTVDEENIEIAILTNTNWIGLAVPTEKIMCQFEHGEAPLPNIDKDTLSRYAGGVIRRQAALGYKLWDAKTYRLIDVSIETEKNSMKMTLGIGSFLQYRYTFGAVRDEVRQAFMDEGLLTLEGIENRNTVISKDDEERLVRNIIQHSKRYLECRDNLLPDGATLCNFREKLSIVGTNVVLAIRRPKPYDDYALIIQKRSRQVSEGPGMLQVIPAGFHQPLLDPEKEMNPKETIYRELFEELFGGEEAVYTTRRLRHDWFCKSSEPMEFLRKHQNSCRLECVAFGVGLPSGVCELAFLFLIDHPDFWENYSQEMRTNWEVVENLDPVISSKDRNSLTMLLKRRDWADSGRFALAEFLIRLKNISPPGMVEIEIERNIGNA